MRARHGIEVVACEAPEEVYRGAHIVAALTDSTVPVLDGNHLEPGTHFVNIGGGDLPHPANLPPADGRPRVPPTPPPQRHPTPPPPPHPPSPPPPPPHTPPPPNPP